VQTVSDIRGEQEGQATASADALADLRSMSQQVVAASKLSVQQCTARVVAAVVTDATEAEQALKLRVVDCATAAEFHQDGLAAELAWFRSYSSCRGSRPRPLASTAHSIGGRKSTGPNSKSATRSRPRSPVRSTWARHAAGGV
jgi:hypothetical protein